MSSNIVVSLGRICILNRHHRFVTCLTHRTFSIQNKNTEKPAHPFDYINKNYSNFSSIIFNTLSNSFSFHLDFFRHYYLGGHYTLANIHDNTLFFHVESNFGVRRSNFVQRLADHIGFLPLPKPDIDRMHFIDETGTINTRHFHNDYCLKRDYLPSPEEWHFNPNYHATVRLLRPLLQTMTYQLRMGLSHMFSTG